MTEILTESFCERCGTRYTFESSAPRKSRLGRVRTLSKGVRNFVLSDESSFSEAMAEARSEEELAATAHQLDAFHKTFNFCLTCRQYTCGECWNSVEGRCLTCAPVPGQEEAASLLDLAPMAAAGLEAGVNGNGQPAAVVDLEAWPDWDMPAAEAWPEMDLPADRLARVLDIGTEPRFEPEVEAVVAGEAEPAEAVFEAPISEPAAAGAAAADAVPADAAAGEASAEPSISGIAPGQSLDEAIAAYEAMIAAEEAERARAVEAPAQPVAAAEPPAVQPTAQPAVTEPEPALATQPEAAVTEPEPAMAAAPEPEPVAEVAPLAAEPEPPAEPIAAAPEAAPEPEPVGIAQPEAAAEPEPSAEPEVEPVAAQPGPALDDHVEQPTWRTPGPSPAPDRSVPPTTPSPAPSPWLRVAPEDVSAPPQWPTAPQWPVQASRQPVPTTIGGRPVVPQVEASAMWAASVQEVLGAAPAPLATSAPPTAQPCVSCGLSLSANARFCRRCGSRQG